MSAETLTRKPAADKSARPFLLGLKIRLKELAYEGTCIRKEEARARERSLKCRAAEQEQWENEHRSDFWALRHHRTGPVRIAARETLLAYCYLRGKRYRQVEASCHQPPNWDQVKRLVMKFGSAGWAAGVEEWAAEEAV